MRFRKRFVAVATVIIWCGLFLTTTTTPVVAEAATLGQTSGRLRPRPNDVEAIVGAGIDGLAAGGPTGAFIAVVGEVAFEAMFGRGGEFFQAPPTAID